MPWTALSSTFAGGIALALFAIAAMPARAEGQILRKAKEAVTRAAETESLNQIDRVVRGRVRCVFDDLECIREAEKQGQEPVLTNDDGTVLVDEAGAPVGDAQSASGTRPGEGAWANYDFQPGNEVLLYDDFTGDEIGDFPRRFELIQGNFEVVEWEGSRYLQATSGGIIALPLPRVLPERFTLEYSVSLQHGNAYLRVMPGRAYHGPGRSYRGTVLSVEAGRAGVRPVGDAGPSSLAKVESRRLKESVVPVRVMVDGEHMKMYLADQRVANVPNAVFPRSDTLFLAVSSAAPAHPILVGPVRLAAGGRDLYDRLARDGRVATHGILFATNSDRIRPESTPTLKEIGSMLREHPELRLRIEGHTDADGEEGYNQELSERRAASVRGYLTGHEDIEAGRLSITGYGESRPMADNTTPEGRQQNRRVELVRLGEEAKASF